MHHLNSKYLTSCFSESDTIRLNPEECCSKIMETLKY